MESEPARSLQHVMMRWNRCDRSHLPSIIRALNLLPPSRPIPQNHQMDNWINQMNTSRRAVRFDAPVGLDEKRGDNHDDTAEGAANRRAAALAALAGGGGSGSGGSGGGNRLTWAATWAPPGEREGAAASTNSASAPEAPKKRLSAK